MEAKTQKQLTAKHDAQQAMIDCACGIYDKWFRYHRSDDGLAYDQGWMLQNKTTQNEEVMFIG